VWTCVLIASASVGVVAIVTIAVATGAISVALVYVARAATSDCAGAVGDVSVLSEVGNTVIATPDFCALGNFDDTLSTAAFAGSSVVLRTCRNVN
jgi:hypothetical protein